MTRNQRLALLVALVVIALAALVGVVVAVNDDDGDGTASPTSASSSTTEVSTTTTTEPSTTSTTEGCGVLAGADTDAKEGTMPSGGMMIDGLEVASTTGGCTDTIVFTFSTASAPEEPGYRVEYQPGPFTEDASGEPVDVDGSAFLVVRLEPAYGYDVETGDPTYTGPTDFRPTGTRYVGHAVNTGDYEGVVSWVFGLSEERPFTVLAAGAPERQLIIEIG